MDRVKSLNGWSTVFVFWLTLMMVGYTYALLVFKDVGLSAIDVYGYILSVVITAFSIWEVRVRYATRTAKPRARQEL